MEAGLDDSNRSRVLKITDRREAIKVATETFVLLENSENILPLAKKGKIALVGPLADTRTNMPGTWSVASL